MTPPAPAHGSGTPVHWGMDSATSTWWSPCRFDVGEARRWRIGPSTWVAERRAHEWRIAHVTSDDPLDDQLEIAAPVRDVDPFSGIGPTGAARRFAFAASPAELALRPGLADRDVVVRPADPLTVPAGESAVLFVSTPLWIAVSTVDPPHALFEAACFQPSDTWFGPSTVDGELCYASRTTGRLDLADVPVRPHRAITPVHIRNQAKDPLALERLKVPVAILPLLSGPRGLWTPRVSLTRAEGADRADVQVAPEPPAEAGPVTRIAEPRRRPDASLSLRSFGRWLGLGATP